MNNCAIICEYNPFHTGHKYQIDVARQYCDGILCIMSGQFVQSALPAFCDKSIRAKAAVLGGADAVVELPTVYATAGAQQFAEGAVEIISGIRDVTHIAMGASVDRDIILRSAEVKKTAKYREYLKEYLKNGKSYNRSVELAALRVYQEKYSEDISDCFTDPNNMLCIEYISAIEKYCAGVEPLIIKRRGALYGQTDIDAEFVSATAIRNCFEAGDPSAVRGFIPYCFDDIIDYRNSHAVDMNLFKDIAVYALKSAPIETIRKTRYCSEGLEYSIKKASKLSSYDAVVDSIVCKRYGKKRIQRIILDILLRIDKEQLNCKTISRLLACRSGFDFSLLPDRIKTTNAEIKLALDTDDQVKISFDIDERATALYNTICHLDGDIFNYSLVKV